MPVVACASRMPGIAAGSLRDLQRDENGTAPLVLADGSRRTFLEDGDVVTVSASAPGRAGSRIGFGEVTGRVLPAC